ncbi:MAG: histidinol phosphatase [Desulfobacteraceae bacterium IS3]|nr:MAG: histidinol phosphatase [Desulfobacteraceae bacterium IS3]
MKAPDFVSVHGGHSGEFCQHAQDSLEDIIAAYIKKNFVWVGITEHIPPPDDRFLYADQKAAGLNAETLYYHFGAYMSTCRRLQKKYSDSVKILAGFETETCSGSEAFVRKLIAEFQPDYIVGSVHHVNDIGFDCSPADYEQAVVAAGGNDELFCRYFDLQYEMINALHPAVVGHFDLIRIFDPDYRTRIEKPLIQKRIERNLQCIKDLDLILDFNLRALSKGAGEPYISRAILRRALELGIAVVPGDDSHSAENAGRNMEKGIEILQSLGADTRWRMPKVFSRE